MGGAVSTGENNDDLVDNLMDANYIKTSQVEQVFRAVDRANYFLEDHRDSAYKDLAWKHNHLHLSAPCIYSEVMEALQLQPGLSFLNIGSGTGYLSTMVGLLLGHNGINHGVELHEDVVEYAREKLEKFKQDSEAFDMFEFCEPQFVVGNCLQLASGGRLYDRVYCGAACPQEHENYMKNLLKIDGILVMPLNDQLQQIRRCSETSWESRNVLPVSFAVLVVPWGENADVVDLPEVCLPSLQETCRTAIRRHLRTSVYDENPDLKTTPITKKRKRPRKPKRHRRINMVPMSMGMMILGHLGDSEDSEDDSHCLQLPPISFPGPQGRFKLDSLELTSDDESVSSLHSQEGEEESCEENDKSARTTPRGRIGRRVCVDEEEEEDEEEDEEEEDEEVKDKEEDEEEVEVVMKEESCEENDTSARTTPRDRRGRKLDVEEEEEDEEEEEMMVKGGEEAAEAGENEEENMDVDVTSEKSAEAGRQKEAAASSSSNNNGVNDRHRGAASSSSSSTSQGRMVEMEFPEPRSGAMELNAIFHEAYGKYLCETQETAATNNLGCLSPPRKIRCSSNTSADTSETSGVGSYGDEVSEPNDKPSPPSSLELEMAPGPSCEGGVNCSPEKATIFRSYMMKKISALPLPEALKSFLSYYRDGSIEED